MPPKLRDPEYRCKTCNKPHNTYQARWSHERRCASKQQRAAAQAEEKLAHPYSDGDGDALKDDLLRRLESKFEAFIEQTEARHAKEIANLMSMQSKAIESMTEIMGKIIVNNNNHTTNVMFSVHDWRSPDTRFWNDQSVEDLVTRDDRFEAVQEAVRKTYCDPTKPHNVSVYVPPTPSGGLDAVSAMAWSTESGWKGLTLRQAARCVGFHSWEPVYKRSLGIKKLSQETLERAKRTLDFARSDLSTLHRTIDTLVDNAALVQLVHPDKPQARIEERQAAPIPVLDDSDAD